MQKESITLTDFKSQEDIVEALKANDEHTLRQLYQSNYFKIEKFVLRNRGSEEQAKDIFQEAFIVMWRNVKEDKFFPQNETALEGYLYQIAKNKWMDYLRSAYHKKTVAMVPQHEANLDQVAAPAIDEADEKLKKAMEAFQGLKEGCKKLLSQFYFEKKSLKEIASELELDPASVKNKKYRCMQELRILALKK